MRSKIIRYGVIALLFCVTSFSNPFDNLFGDLKFSNPFNPGESSEEEIDVDTSLSSIKTAIERLRSRNQELKERLQCFAIQRHILKAMENYEKGQNKKITLFGKGEIKILVEKGYLPAVPSDPGCKFGDNYRSDRKGNLWCHNHGTLGGASVLIKDGWMTEKDAEGSGVCNMLRRKPQVFDI
jgi:hypothetical protein